MEDNFDYNEINLDLFPQAKRDLVQQVESQKGPLFEQWKELSRLIKEADPYKGML